MLRILILITCIFLFPDIYGVSIFQFCGRYEYNCYYYDGKLYMNLAKIPCHELVITQVDISNNCLDVVPNVSQKIFLYSGNTLSNNPIT